MNIKFAVSRIILSIYLHGRRVGCAHQKNVMSRFNESNLGGLAPRRLSENRKATMRKRILARFSPDFRQIEPLLSSNHEKI